MLEPAITYDIIIIIIITRERKNRQYCSIATTNRRVKAMLSALDLTAMTCCACRLQQFTI